MINFTKLRKTQEKSWWLLKNGKKSRKYNRKSFSDWLYVYEKRSPILLSELAESKAGEHQGFLHSPHWAGRRWSGSGLDSYRPDSPADHRAPN